MMDSYSREVAASEKCRRYRQDAEAARRLPREGIRCKLALLMHKVADWLEPESSTLHDLERTA